MKKMLKVEVTDCDQCSHKTWNLADYFCSHDRGPVDCKGYPKPIDQIDFETECPLDPVPDNIKELRMVDSLSRDELKEAALEYYLKKTGYSRGDLVSIDHVKITAELAFLDIIVKENF